MKTWELKDSCNLHYTLALIEADTNIEALKKYQEKHKPTYDNCPITPYCGTYAIRYGYDHTYAITAWEHFQI